MNCPTCGWFGYEPDDVLRALKAFDWDEFRWSPEGDTAYVRDLGVVTVVAAIQPQDYDSYGGSIEDEPFVVIRVPDGRLFKREAYRDSYSGLDWKTDIREVKPQPRTVTVYDYA